MKYIRYAVALLVLLLVFQSGWWLRDQRAQGELRDMLQNHVVQLNEIEVVRTRQIGSLTKVLADSDANQSVLLDQLASMKSRPAQIKYIVRTETVVQGTTVVLEDLPDSHLFKLKNGLAVAEFKVEAGPSYLFDTADLTLRADLIIGERDSSLSLRAESSLDPDNEIEIPIQELHVQRIREQKFFEPHITLGAQAGVTSRPTFQYGLSGGASLLHANKFDLVHIQLGVTRDAALIGLNPVLYNLGEALPVITNLWIGAGPTINTRGEPGGSLYLGAKL